MHGPAAGAAYRAAPSALSSRARGGRRGGRRRDRPPARRQRNERGRTQGGARPGARPSSCKSCMLSLASRGSAGVPEPRLALRERLAGERRPRASAPVTRCPRGAQALTANAQLRERLAEERRRRRVAVQVRPPGRLGLTDRDAAMWCIAVPRRRAPALHRCRAKQRLA